MQRNQIKKIREARRLSQADVADALGVTSQTVSRQEAEDSRINIPTLSKYSRVLKVSIGQLVGEVPFSLDEDASPFDHEERKLEPARVVAVADALDHYLAANKLKVAAGGRGELIVAIYDWSVDAGVPIDKVHDFSAIRSFLKPRLIPNA